MSSIIIPPYARDHRIHNFGNTGLGGFVHAHLAPIATHVIDNLAYNGVNIRQQILEEYGIDNETNVVDLGCGTGLSTQNGGLGVDTSLEMLHVARAYFPGKTFLQQNAEVFGKDREFDVATLFYVLHEAPATARLRLIDNAMRIAKRVVIADISPSYRPSSMMLTGEPYVLGYLRNIEWEVQACADVSGRKVTKSYRSENRVVVFQIEA